MCLSFVRMSEFTVFFLFICFNFCNFFSLYFFFYAGVFHLSCESTTHFNFLRRYFSSFHICHSHAFYTRFVTSFSLTLSLSQIRILFRSQRSQSLSLIVRTLFLGSRLLCGRHEEISLHFYCTLNSFVGTKLFYGCDLFTVRSIFIHVHRPQTNKTKRQARRT